MITKNHKNKKIQLGGIVVLFLIGIIMPLDGQEIDSPIHFYNGSEQVFGESGVQQPIINIPGKIDNPVNLYSLSYRFNKIRRPLNVGPTPFRLSEPGEFNIELDRRGLSKGKHHLTVIAIYSDGQIYKRNISFTVHDQKSELPLQADFTRLNSIPKEFQVVDGEWGITPDGLQNKTIGYDRAIAVGDTTWSDYEVEVEFILNGIATDSLAYGWPSMGAAIHVAVRWRGHEDWNDIYPRRGWSNFGALFSYETTGTKSRKLIWIYDQEEKKSEKTGMPFNIETGEKYRLIAQVTSNDQRPSNYRMKLWKVGEIEPSDWEINTNGKTGEIRNGSILLVAHHSIVTFIRITISPINSEYQK